MAKDVPPADIVFINTTFGQVLNMTNSMGFTEVYDDPSSLRLPYCIV